MADQRRTLPYKKFQRRQTAPIEATSSSSGVPNPSTSLGSSPVGSSLSSLAATGSMPLRELSGLEVQSFENGRPSTSIPRSRSPQHRSRFPLLRQHRVQPGCVSTAPPSDGTNATPPSDETLDPEADAQEIVERITSMGHTDLMALKSAMESLQPVRNTSPRKPEGKLFTVDRMPSSESSDQPTPAHEHVPSSSRPRSTSPRRTASPQRGAVNPTRSRPEYTAPDTRPSRAMSPSRRALVDADGDHREEKAEYKSFSPSGAKGKDKTPRVSPKLESGKDRERTSRSPMPDSEQDSGKDRDKTSRPSPVLHSKKDSEEREKTSRVSPILHSNKKYSGKERDDSKSHHGIEKDRSKLPAGRSKGGKKGDGQDRVEPVGHVEKLLNQDKIVTINVSGKLFQTYVKTLRKMPGTTLCKYVEPGGELLNKGHIFLDRNHKAFTAVLTYYRSDRLLKPLGVPDDIWREELTFYEIRNPNDIVPTEKEMVQMQIKQGMPPNDGWRKKLWLFFEDPASSQLATYQSIFGIMVIVIAVASFIAETHPTFRMNVDKSWYGYTTEDVFGFFRAMETFVVLYFTNELVCRIVATTQKLKFMTKLPNIIDFIAVAPFYIDKFPGVSGGSGLMVVRVFRLTRIFRIIGMVFKLGKYSSGAKVLGGTIIGCSRELLILGFVFFMAVVIFSAGIFFCENPDTSIMGSEYDSVLTGMYWAGVTITTVGYGDFTPVTSCGQAVAVCAAISGIFCLGLPISVITTKFNERYQEMLQEIKVEEDRKKFKQAKKEIGGMRGLRAFGAQLLDMQGGGLMSSMFGFGASGKATSAEANLTMAMKVAKDVFASMDDDDSGQLDREELQVAMAKMGFDIPPDAMDYMFDYFDEDKNGHIEFDEFKKFVEMTVRGDLPTDEEIQAKALQNSIATKDSSVKINYKRIQRNAW